MIHKTHHNRMKHFMVFQVSQPSRVLGHCLYYGMSGAVILILRLPLPYRVRPAHRLRAHRDLVT